VTSSRPETAPSASSAPAGSVRLTGTDATAGAPDSGSDPYGSDRSIGDLVAAASKDLSTLIRNEIELAKTELRADAKSAGKGAGLLAAAGFLGIFVLLMLLVALAETLTSIGVPRPLSYFLVAVLLMIVMAVLGLMGKKALAKVKPPQRTIETAKDTVAWAKHPTSAA